MKAARPDLMARRFLRMQREQWLSREELQQIQWTRFKRLLNHATQHSPFYRQRFRDVGLKPGDIRSRADIKHIPITTRDDLQSPERFIVGGQTLDSLRHSSSSGSTGKQVKTYFGADAWFHGKLLLKLRARLACGLRPWDRIGVIRSGRLPTRKLRERMLRQRSFSVHAPFDDIRTDLHRYSPTILYGFPGHFNQMAEGSKPGFRPRMVFTSGEKLDNWKRRRIEAFLDTTVYDIYGCTELKEIAWECPNRDGYHINADWLLVESNPPASSVDQIDDALIVTSLYNYDMPLIRYQVGDTGRLVNDRCSCGRSLPLMAPTFGRSVDYFLLPSGQQISPYTLINEIEVLKFVRQFQIVQLTADHVLVNVVPAKGFDSESANTIVRTLQPHLRSIRIDVREMDEIARELSGKYRETISNVKKKPGL